MKILVIQGAGMDVRGQTQVEIFGPETLDEINTQILDCAQALGLDVEIYQSNDEDQVATKLQGAQEFDALIINPGGFTTSQNQLPEAIGQLDIPVYEVHASNPASRGVQSTLLPMCRGAVCGFGYAGYAMVLQAIHDS
jgi:3-dehydroquinate dehydratase-2